MKVALAWLAVTLGLTGVARTTAADEASPVPAGLVRFRTFGSAEGLHNIVITGITQDASGALWVGTDGGITRYDGQRFTAFGVAEGMPATQIQVVAVGPDGNVCAGTSSGLACWDGQRFARTGPALLDVVSLVAYRDSLWIGTTSGLFVADRHRVVSRAVGWPTAKGAVKALWADAHGLIAGNDGNVMTSAGDGRWDAIPGLALAGDRVDGVLRDRQGGLWIRTALHMWRLAAGAAHAEDITQGLPVGYDSVIAAVTMVNGPRGEVWIVTDRGIAHRDGDHWRLIDQQAGFPGAGARSVYVDREGSLWVGGIGLSQWRGHGLTIRHDLSSGFAGSIAWSIARDHSGTLWTGTDRCLARATAGRWECLAGTENRIVRSMVLLPDGGVFLGGAPGDLLYIDAAGQASSIPIEPQTAAELTILALAIGPEGDLWIGTKVGLFRLPGARPGPVERVTVPHIPATAVYRSLQVIEGRLWTATVHGIAVLDHGAWHVFDAAWGFHSSSMRYLVPSHDHRMCAAYTDGIGVTCFTSDGRTVSDVRDLGVPEGLHTGMAYFLGEDRRKRLWIGTGDGLDVVTPQGIEHFDERDGIAGNDSAATAFFEDTDGSVWLGSTGGLTHVLAQHYVGPPPAPHTVVSGQLGEHAIGAFAQSIETPHDHNALTLELGTDTLHDGDRIEYEVRLSPLEREWTETRLRQARYPALLPGTYRLEMRARRDSGAWGPVSELHFVVQSPWWQTRWFELVAMLTAIGILILAYRWRQRAIQQRRTRQFNEQSHATFSSLLEAVPDLITVHREGRLTYLNAAARRLLLAEGPADRLPAFPDWTHPDDRARARDMMEHAREVDASHVAEVVELRVHAGDGSWRICDVASVRMEVGGAPLVVVTARDVTERHRLRAKLLLSDRMASLGTLAAGIAHEINNPLAYVVGNLQLIADGLHQPVPATQELAAAVADASEGAERVRRIVRGLASFTRSEEERRVAVQIPDVLRAAIRFTANEVRHRAQLVCQLDPIPSVLADDGRLIQVFINLIVNAAHAIPEGHSDANRITLRTRQDEQGRAVIEVTDTGLGMSAEVLERVFDPFFTTKVLGAGTGLGLSICHGIIDSIGGQIAIESAPGQGTTVRVVLPGAVTTSVPPVLSAPVLATPQTSGAPAAARPTSHVLIVDDEPKVADMLARALRRDHQVTVASCGQAALDLVAAGTWFDAIISDVMMPNMTGIELLDRLAVNAPQQARRFVFLSGGVFTTELRTRLDALGTVHLEKPISAKELRSSVAGVVAGEPGPPAHDRIAACTR